MSNFINVSFPVISVQKSGKGAKIACFNEFEVVRDFIYYDDEALGIAIAKQFFADKTNIDPEIVRPVITKMTMRYAKRKR